MLAKVDEILEKMEAESECDDTGLTCNPECDNFLGRIRDHPCFQGDGKYLLEFILPRDVVNNGQNLTNMLRSCDGNMLRSRSRSHKDQTKGGTTWLIPSGIMTASGIAMVILTVSF